jgi:hypothetical protein
MDELKDFIDIRIATRCPLCGKRFKKLSIELDDSKPVWINGQCDCGLSLELDNTDRKVVTCISLSDKDILDEWNEVSSK